MKMKLRFTASNTDAAYWILILVYIVRSFHGQKFIISKLIPINNLIYRSLSRKP